MSFLGASPLTAPPGGYSTVYAFGDSLSDAGNVSLSTLGTVPVSPPYDGGRFTDGAVWVQDLSQDIGLPPVKPSMAGGTDFAYGGAETGQTQVHAVNPTDLPGQLAQFVAAVPHPQSNALYTVWIGSNDVLGIANDTSLTPAQQQSDVQTAVGNETNFISSLVSHGATDLVVLNLPDLGKTPYERARPTADATASKLAADYNTDVSQSLQQVVASSGAKIDLVDTYSLLDGVIANPGAYGFTNVTTPVWNGNLTSSSSGTLAASGAAQGGYLFFDDLHPTAQTHALLAKDVAQGLTGTA